MRNTRWVSGTPGLLGLILIASVFTTPCLAGMRTEFQKALAAFDEAQRIQLDEPDRARRLFRSAAQRFGGIIAGGVANGRLEFNLANCYLQAGDVGRAILHFRRAERLIPGDEMLGENLATARSRCLLHVEQRRRSVLSRSVFFWHYETSLAGRTRAAFAAYIAFWALLILRSFAVNGGPRGRTQLPRRAISATAIACAVFAASVGVSVGATHWCDRHAPEGVVTAIDVVVSKGPGIGYQRQFEQPLQPGVEFTLRERRRGWFRVELADGKSGWIEASSAELILTDSM